MRLEWSQNWRYRSREGERGSNTARPGPWQSTWTKPTLWSFRKDPDPREHNTFTLGTNQITHASHYNYLGLKITSTGNFNHAVNELRDKARRAFYAIKRQCPIEIPIRIRAENGRIGNWAHCTMAVRCGVHWQTQVKISPNGKNIRLRLCMQNSEKIYYTCTGTQQITHAGQN